MNKIIMMGTLVRDTELKYLDSGTAIANNAVAVNKKWKDKNTGELKEEVCFIDLTVFGKRAEVFSTYFNKSSRVMIEGELKQDKWVDNDGNNKSKHSINVSDFYFVDRKDDAPKQDSHNESKSNGYQPQQKEEQNTTVIDFSDPNVLEAMKKVMQMQQFQKPTGQQEMNLAEENIPF